ncbi:MAG: hypothetical protein E7270_09215 [Lachnospiraceae bacterium]|nr:hypothetical protein [Lachnospiraceae bacterium]
MSQIVVAPILLLLIAAVSAVVLFVIYLIVYRININKALKENNGKHIALPDVQSIVAIILILILFFNIFSLKSQLTELQNNMDTFRSNTSQKISNLQDTVNDLYNLTKKENSLISNYEFETLNFNTEKMTVDIKFMITLKNFNDKTTVSVSIGDKTIKLNNSSTGIFSGTINISIFDNITDATVFISDGTTTQSEILSDVNLEYIWMKHIPSIDADFYSDLTYKNDKVYFNDNILYIFLNNPDKHRFTDLYVEIFVDNKSLKKIDIDYSNLKEDYEVKFKDPVEVPNSDSIIDIYVMGTDSAGITHKYIVFSGNEYSSVVYDSSEVLYDSDGSRLTEDILK